MAARKVRLAIGMACAAAAASLPAPAGAAPAIGGFSVRPAESNPGNPATRAYFVQSLAPGSYVRDEVVLSNLSSRPMRLRVYPVDGVTGVTSGAVYTNRGTTLRKAGRWVRTDISLVSLAPHAQSLVPFVVGVPATGTPGDHLAGIAVENTHHQTSQGRFAVTEIVRAVVGVEIEVPGGAAPQLTLRGTSLKALPGTRIPSVIVDLANIGRRLCKPLLTVGLTGSGAPRLVVQRRLDTILPGDAIPYPLPWPRPLGSGSYRETASASGCGHRVRMSRVVSLSSPLSGTTANPGYVATPTGGTPWWLIALVGLAGLAAGVGLTLHLGRGRSKGLPTSG